MILLSAGDMIILNWRLKKKKLTQSEAISVVLDKGGPYMILMDPFGQLKRVIVRTYDYDFVDCIASSTEIPAYVSHSNGEVSTKSKGITRSGFDCNGIFFDEKELHLARNLARESGKSRHNVYPMEHFSPPCDSPCLLWPLKPSGSMIRNGNLAPYRLVMSLDFQILFVALKGREKMKKCEKRTIAGGNINHDQSSFRCGKMVFHNSELLPVVDKACKNIMLHLKKYPMSYEGENFQVPGPYLIYPLMKDKEYIRGWPGLYFIVMNYDCVLAGVLMTRKKYILQTNSASRKVSKTSVKCVAFQLDE
ncbi:putative guanyl-specific ribonuclease f1 [Erysiphe necator]|uniref:Putative guanyl-specific ribonuclease f1 n=1 Tax=Uncinula necator TaxID=52586 RepID=A0A0B1NZL4_UNCNE|nr:putative guanyl-specific ribonuclease f1 [Erysiphe necator]